MDCSDMSELSTNSQTNDHVCPSLSVAQPFSL